jgi:hypothetical protein
MDKILMWLITNAHSASIIVYLLLTLVFSGYALHKGWIVLGKTHGVVQKAYDTMVPAMDAVEAKLADQRVLNERATVTIEYLRAENERQAQQIERLEHELAIERARGGTYHGRD